VYLPPDPACLGVTGQCLEPWLLGGSVGFGVAAQVASEVLAVAVDGVGVAGLQTEQVTGVVSAEPLDQLVQIQRSLAIEQGAGDLHCGLMVG